MSLSSKLVRVAAALTTGIALMAAAGSAQALTVGTKKPGTVVTIKCIKMPVLNPNGTIRYILNCYTVVT